jgi:methionyl-tRNA synthetase
MTDTEPAVPQARTVAETKAEITFDDFTKIDLRVATVTAAEAHPNADRLLKLQLDDGSPDGRQVCAGIKAWYDPATLVGRQVVIVANLAARKLRGEISQGMVLAASSPTDEEGGEDVVVVVLDRPAKPGATVS